MTTGVKMKNLSMIKMCLSILTLILLAVFGCDMRFKPYSNATYKFKMKYPKTWQLRENAEGAAVVFISPKETPLDTYSENLSVVIQNLNGRPMPLAQYTQEAIYQLTRTLKNIQALNSSGFSLSGRAAHKFEYVFKSDFKIKIMHIWTLKDKMSYQITFGCDMDRCDDYMATVNEMIDSFEFD